MNRPSFQFYPGDWSSNPNLKRCTFAERGIWLEVMCLMHDQAEYGVLRWPLKEIAQAVGCRATDLQGLARKGVLKGSDEYLSDPYIYTPRSGRRDGAPVTLIAAQRGPVWYSSRMVRDEHIRITRGFSGGDPDAPKGTSKPTPKGGIGEALGAPFGPRVPSSSSSPSGGVPISDDIGGAHAKPDRKRATRNAGITFLEYLAERDESGVDHLPSDSAPVRYAAKIGLPEDYFELAWTAFAVRYSADENYRTKRYKDWPAAFLNALKGNWFKLWYVGDGGAYLLTTAGKQAASERAVQAQRPQQGEHE